MSDDYVFIDKKEARLHKVSSAALHMNWQAIEILAKKIENIRSRGLESKKRVTAEMIHKMFYQCSLSLMDRASDFYSQDTGSSPVENTKN
jgi:hypothetical protein